MCKCMALSQAFVTAHVPDGRFVCVPTIAEKLTVCLPYSRAHMATSFRLHTHVIVIFCLIPHRLPTRLSNSADPHLASRTSPLPQWNNFSRAVPATATTSTQVSRAHACVTSVSVEEECCVSGRRVLCQWKKSVSVCQRKESVSVEEECVSGRRVCQWKKSVPV